MKHTDKPSPPHPSYANTAGGGYSATCGPRYLLSGGVNSSGLQETVGGNGQRDICAENMLIVAPFGSLCSYNKPKPGRLKATSTLDLEISSSGCVFIHKADVCVRC